MSREKSFTLRLIDPCDHKKSIIQMRKSCFKKYYLKDFWHSDDERMPIMGIFFQSKLVSCLFFEVIRGKRHLYYRTLLKKPWLDKIRFPVFFAREIITLPEFQRIGLTHVLRQKFFALAISHSCQSVMGMVPKRASRLRHLSTLGYRQSRNTESTQCIIISLPKHSLPKANQMVLAKLSSLPFKIREVDCGLSRSLNIAEQKRKVSGILMGQKNFLQTKPKVEDHILMKTEFDGSILLINLTNSDIFRVHGLSVKMLRQLNGKNSISDIIKKQSKILKITERELAKEALKFIRDLRKMRLVSFGKSA